MTANFLTTNFASSPAQVPTVLVVIDALIILAALTLWGLVIWLGVVWLRNKLFTNQTIKIVNHSNVATRFHLQADLGERKTGLATSWLLDGRALPQQTVETVTYVEEKTEVKEATGSKPGVKKKGNFMNAFMSKYRFFRSIATLFANIFSAVGSLLPESIKKPFVDASATIRDTQSTADATLTKPKAIMNSTNQLKSNMKQLETTTGVKPGMPGAEKPAPKPVVPEKQFRRVVTSAQVIETEPLKPQESVTIQVRLMPRNPFKKNSGELRFSSLQMEDPDCPPNELLKPNPLLWEYAIPQPDRKDLLTYGGISLAFLLVNIGWASLLIHWISRLVMKA